MLRKVTLLLLIAAGGLGCWALYRHVVRPPAEASPVVTKKPSPGIPAVAAVTPSTPGPATTAPAITAPAPEAYEADAASNFIAMRLDDTRIYVALGTEGLDVPKEGDPVTKLGDGPSLGVGPVFQISDEFLKEHQKLFGGVHVGEELELEATPESRVPVVVTAPVMVQTGCFAAPGFVAQIATANQPSFTAVGKEYFLLHKADTAAVRASDPKSQPIGELADWKATPEFSALLEKLLNERMQQELAKIHKELSGEYEREAARNPKGKPWPKIDDKLAHGEGKFDYDTQAFQLRPDGLPRIYVRAQWTIGGKAAFLMSAWVKADATPSIEAVDPHVANLMRMSEMEGSEVGLEKIPKILNVFDPQRDHHAQVLMYSSGYEGMDMTLYRYTDVGPVRTRVSVGGGC